MAAENLVGLGPGQGRAVSSVIREEPATRPRPAAPEQPTGTSAREAEPKPGTPRLCRPDQRNRLVPAHQARPEGWEEKG